MKKNKNGFTLIELMAVVVILGIVAMIAAPTVNGIISMAQVRADKKSAVELLSGTRNFCISSNLSGKNVTGDLLTYQYDGVDLNTLIGFDGEMPDYSNFVQYEIDKSCNVKIIYQKNGLACSNQLNTAGEYTFIKSSRNTTSQNIYCEEKNETILNVDYDTDLLTDGELHTLKSYYSEDDEDIVFADFKSEEYRDTIYEIAFVNYTKPSKKASVSWDVSENQDGSIIAWITPLATGSKWNKLYIGSTGTIMANSNSGLLFGGMTNLTKISFGNFKTDYVTNMAGMFSADTSLTYLNLSNFNISNVTNMMGMFSADTSLTSLDLSGWDTSNVTNMNYMFASNRSNPMIIEEINGIEAFDTSNVTNMDSMFAWNTKIKSLDLSKWDTSNVTNMYNLFYGMESLEILDVSTWDTSNVTDMNYMFADLQSLVNLDVSNFDTSNVTDMSGMFLRMFKVSNLDVSNFDTSNVTNMEAMFAVCESLTSLDVSNFDTSNVTDMNSMFDYMPMLKSIDVSNFNTSKVIDMAYMFYYDYNLTSLDLSNFDTSSVEYMNGMFGTYFEVENNKIISFSKLSEIKGIENLNTSKVTSFRNMFQGNNGLTSLDLSKWDVSNVTTMYGMFYGVQKLKTINITGWNTKSLTDMGFMFGGGMALTNSETYDGVGFYNSISEIIGLGDLNTSNVTDMDATFHNNPNITVLDLSNWDTSNVTTTASMFSLDTKLTTIYASDKFVITNIKYDTYMFNRCYKLVGKISYNSKKISKDYANLDNYFTLKSE